MNPKTPTKTNSQELHTSQSGIVLEPDGSPTKEEELKEEIMKLEELLNKPIKEWEDWRKPKIMELVEHLDYVAFWFDRLQRLKAELKGLKEGSKQTLKDVLKIIDDEMEKAKSCSAHICNFGDFDREEDICLPCFERQVLKELKAQIKELGVGEK
jgi:hypothetical protein